MTERTADTAYACGWTLDDGCCAKLAAAFEDETTAVIAQRCVDQAAEILYALSGRQFGACEITVRPCRQDCSDGRVSGLYGYPWTPQLINGSWVNTRCGRCKTDCSCTEVCELFLPGFVASVSEVKIDGVVLDDTDYRVDNGRNLVAMGDCWPKCQDMSLADTEVGTFSVTYVKGRPLPVAGQAALGALACELCKACVGDASCCLPARVTSITRQGYSIAMLDPMEFLKDGRTGVYAVDVWLAAVNPKGRSRYAGVFSPDVVPGRVTTWP